MIDRSRLPVTLGETVASPSFVKAIDAINSSNGQRFETLEVQHFISPDEPRELHFKLIGLPFTVKTLVEQDTNEVLQALEDSLEFFGKNGGAPQKTLDLRVEGRAVYR